MDIKERQKKIMEAGAANVTKWIGSTSSVLLHTILFLISFVLPIMGLVSFERMLLVLTTIVSLEAIYLSIFIQMSINMSNQNIEIIQEDIEELGEDIEEMSEDIEEISEDIEEIGEDIEELGEDIEEMSEDIEEIQKDVDEMQDDEEEITEETIAPKESSNKKESDILMSIQATLANLQKEIEELKRTGK